MNLSPRTSKTPSSGFWTRLASLENKTPKKSVSNKKHFLILITFISRVVTKLSHNILSQNIVIPQNMIGGVKIPSI